MLLPAPLSAFDFTYDNWGAAPGTGYGTAVTPGASNAEGAWTQIASAANIAVDCYWLHIVVTGGGRATAIKNHLLDIGVDPAGGTSYTAILSNLVCGQTSAVTAVGQCKEFLLPLYIAAGSSVAVRVQGNNATAGTVRVAAMFFGKPTRPEACPTGMFSETLGTIGAASDGQSFTPGTAAWGSYATLGTLAKPCWWFQLGHQVNNATVTAEYVHIEVAYGDASNKHLLLKSIHAGTTNETTYMLNKAMMTACQAYRPLPAGTNLYIRGWASDAPDTGYNATLIAVGG